jgi:hypothetical protein
MRVAVNVPSIAEGRDSGSETFDPAMSGFSFLLLIFRYNQIVFKIKKNMYGKNYWLLNARYFIFSCGLFDVIPDRN